MSSSHVTPPPRVMQVRMQGCFSSSLRHRFVSSAAFAFSAPSPPPNLIQSVNQRTFTYPAIQGMVRDRTQQFIKYRSSSRKKAAAHHGDEDPEKRLLGSEAAPSAAALALAVAPAWVDISSDISSGIEDIKTKLGKLTAVHSRAMLTTFDDTSATHEQEVEVLTQEITRLFKRSEGKLVSLAQVPGSESDVKVRQNVQRQLASELQTLSMEFRKQQKTYLQKVRAREEGSSMSGGKTKAWCPCFLLLFVVGSCLLEGPKTVFVFVQQSGRSQPSSFSPTQARWTSSTPPWRTAAVTRTLTPASRTPRWSVSDRPSPWRRSGRRRSSTSSSRSMIWRRS